MPRSKRSRLTGRTGAEKQRESVFTSFARQLTAWRARVTCCVLRASRVACFAPPGPGRSTFHRTFEISMILVQSGTVSGQFLPKSVRSKAHKLKGVAPRCNLLFILVPLLHFLGHRAKKGRHQKGQSASYPMLSFVGLLSTRGV